MKKIVILIFVLFLWSNLSGQWRTAFDNLYRSYSENYWKKISLFHVKRISLGIGSEYTDNFFNQPNRFEADFSIGLSSSLQTAFLHNNLFILEAKGNLTYTSFLKHTEYNYLDRDISLSLFLRLNRFIISNNFNRSLSRVRIYDFFGRFALANEERKNIGLSYETARNTIFYFYYTHEIMKLTGQLAEDIKVLPERFNRDTDTLGFEFRYRIASKTFFSISNQFFNQKFVLDPRRNFTGSNLIIGFVFPDFGSESKLQGTIIFGLKFYHLSFFKKKKIEWIGNTGFSFGKGNLKLNIKLNRDLSPTFWENIPFQLNTSFNVKPQFFLTRFLAFSLGFSVGEIKFPDPFFIGWERRFVKARFNSPILGLNVRLFYGFGLQIEYYNYNWQSDDLEYYNQKRKAIRISLSKWVF